ncbi:6-carboxytetrahydropterin synthase QueD [candidate division KSB1 bacterium]|nr:MAG: 6-carboxytetrahydropterin synthase QueD [candidate division KSB1 bacterium]
MYHIFYETRFAAAHHLQGYNGMCSELHGHTWKVRVEIKADQKDEIGISFDFKKLKSITGKVIDRLDHHYINEVPPFDKKNPTAENLAEYFFHEVGILLPKTVAMSKVIVWESESYGVSFEG